MAQTWARNKGFPCTASVGRGDAAVSLAVLGRWERTRQPQGPLQCLSWLGGDHPGAQGHAEPPACSTWSVFCLSPEKDGSD